MKNLSNSNSIKDILISENIKCDAIMISDKSLQYSLLYHSDSLKVFTDNITRTILQYMSRQCIINGIPKFINQRKYPNINFKEVSTSLSKINSAFTTYQLLHYSFDFIEDFYKSNKIKKMNYQSFYSSKSDSLIMLNNDLLNHSFDDIIQSSLDCKELCGVYINQDSNQLIILYYDPISTQYKLKFE